MINLLPEKNKKRLKIRENWKKGFLVILFFLVFLVIVSGIISLYRIKIEKEAKMMEKKLAGKVREIHSPEFKGFQERITGLNKNLVNAEEFIKREILVSEVLEKISNIMPEEIFLESFSYQKKIDEETKTIEGKFYLSGFSEKREGLLEFREKLQGVGFFNIYFMPDSWVKKEKAPFSFSFKVKKDI